MNQDDLSVDKELLQIALLIFSAVSLATLEFIKNAFPSEDVLQASKTSVVYLIILVQVVPALLLLLADRVIAARDKSGRVLRWFRTALFAVALLLILRQLQLYWGPAEDLTEEVRSVSPVLLAFVGLAALAGVVWLSMRLFRGVVLFFYYMSPVAIAMTAIVPFQVPTGGALPEGYAQEVERAGQSESKPAVFILIFDELAYGVLAEEGELDAESFPNFAALAQDGAWFTNATASKFWTTQAVPLIINSVTPLAEQFDIRLYLQSKLTEDQYVSDCGKEYTCRGVRYLTENERLSLATNLALRSFYQATPESLETVMRTPTGWILRGLDSAYPPVDTAGIHILSKKQFEVLLSDIDGQESLGRIHVLHSMVPHPPFVFNEKGRPVSPSSTTLAAADVDVDDAFANYRKQAMFVDSLLGKLMDRLKGEGIYDKSVIIVTSDHGLRRVFPSVGAPIEVNQLMVQVPLVIRAPGLHSEISDVDYQHIDFGPTLADVLGLPPPDESQGVSAFSRERPTRDKVFEATDWVNNWTYVYNQEDDSWHLSEQ